MKKVFVLDNYDSFTFNLVQYIDEIEGVFPTVKRNDAFEIEALEEYSHIVLSPGPGLPEKAGLLLDVISKYKSTKKILGVCLGHQALGIESGAKLKNLPQVFHGVSTSMFKTKRDNPILKGLDNEYEAGRYHSWVIDKTSLTNEYQITSLDSDGEIMSMMHKEYPVFGIQYHPESILTPKGKTIISNFLAL